MGVVHIMEQTANELLEALERNDPHTVAVAQERFLQAVEEAWKRYQDGGISVNVRGLPRVMYQWVMEELPQKVKDPARWPEVRRELTRFLRTVEWVVVPRETGE